MGQPTLKSIRHTFDQLAAFAIHFDTTKWRGKYGFLLIVLTKTKIRLVADIQDPKCRCIKWHELLNTKIKEDTKGGKILQLQEDHKFNWQEYTFQGVINAVAV